MADFLVSKRVIDYLGLNIKAPPERYFLLFKDLSPSLALLQGMGSDGAKLVSVDANGNLQVTLAGQFSESLVGIVDPGGNQVNSDGESVDGLGFNRALVAASILRLYNGANLDRLRSVSAANLAAQSGIGAALTSGVGTNALQHSPAAGAQATISRAAQGAGIRNVCKGVGFGFSSGAALGAASTVIINLRDGATGAGTILKSWIFDLPAAIIAPFAVELPVNDIPGTANVAMTLESSAAVAGLRVFVNLQAYSAS